MRGLSGSDGAKNRDGRQSDGARIFARYGSLLPLLAAIATGCATQDDGELPSGGGGYDTGGMNDSGSAGKPASSGGNATGGTSAGNAAVAGSTSGGKATGGSGGDAEGGSAGMSMSGSGGANGGSANGGSAGKGGSGGATGGGGSGGKGGSGGAGGASGGGGAGGKAGSGGTGGSGGMSGAGGSGGTPGCALVTDCPNDNNTVHNVCDAGKCRARGCNGTNCAYELTRFIIGAPTASSARGQVFVSYNMTSLNLDFQIADKTALNDSGNNWDDDSIEIYLDLNNSKAKPYDADDFQIMVPRDAGTTTGIGNITYGSIVVVRTENANGYEIKVTVPWAALNGAGSQLGKTIGFSLGLNDDADGGDRNTQVMLYGGDQNFNDPNGFGNLNLL